MRASIFISSVFAAAAFAQDSSSIDPAPQTSRLTQTNSLGVVTGQPAAETSIPALPPADTSIPAVATSVGVPASIPALGPGINTVALPGDGNSTRTLVISVNPGSNFTSIITPTPSSQGSAGVTTGSPSQQTDANGSPITTGAGSTPTGNAADNMHMAAGSFVGLGALIAAFL